MAKKKAAQVATLCPHCQAEFKIPMRWCSRCESHQGGDTVINGACDRCRTGENDAYLAHKVGSGARVAAAVAAIVAEHGEFKEPFASAAVLAYNIWCESPEYKNRFVRPDEVIVPVKTPEKANEEWIDEHFAGL